MRVLMTTDTVGGVWTFTRQLSTSLLARGHAIALVSFGREPSTSQQQWCDVTAARFAGSFEYTTGDAPLEWMQQNEAACERGAALLLSVAKEFAPDLLLASQYCFAAVPLSIPKVVVAHSDVLSWARSCGRSPLPSSAWLDRYVRLVDNGLQAAAAVVAPTSWMLSALGAGFRFPKIAEVIPNGYTLETATPSIPRKHQAVTGGRLWDEAKNLALLQDLALPLPVFVAGSLYALEPGKRADHAGMTFVGELSETMLHKLFRESAVYLCTSIYEPFGLAPLEAALCGCAVVANDLPSLREVWGDGALFFTDGASLQDRLYELQDPNHLRRAQQRSCARAKMFTAARMADKYLELFERLVPAQPDAVTGGAYAA